MPQACRLPSSWTTEWVKAHTELQVLVRQGWGILRDALFHKRKGLRFTAPPDAFDPLVAVIRGCFPGPGG